ncbi:MAG TPA: tyrosine-type recombinase/integrase, partial [Lacunisphaera sp.]|nr:tyrosine-type recombinase/integrase [Lacunisphaera sp.]
RFHDLRHAAASILLQSGVDLATVSQRLGHGSKTTTLGIYSHCLEGGQDKAASIMGKVIGGTC